MKYLIFGFLLPFLSCKNIQFEKKDFIGTWKSGDGASIILNQDGTCVLTNLDNGIVSIPKYENEKLTSKGTWQIVDDVDSGITTGIGTGVKITYQLMNREGKGGILFYISGKGISENNPPWDLFIWNGDPDQMIKYEFSKQ